MPSSVSLKSGVKLDTLRTACHRMNTMNETHAVHAANATHPEPSPSVLTTTLVDTLTGLSPVVVGTALEGALLTCSAATEDKVRRAGLRRLAFAVGRARRLVERAAEASLGGTEGGGRAA
jgi:hypothetical protein